MRRLLILALMVGIANFMLLSVACAQEEDEKQSPTEDSLDSILTTPKSAPEPAADAKPAKPEEAPPTAIEVPKEEFPVDPRNLRISIKMKNGKSINGRVKNFLISERLVDHMGDPAFSLCDGPTVQYEMNEFVMDWSDIGTIVFNKKNKENGEISCVEVSDVSLERMECIMINEFSAFARDKSKKGAHIIIDKNLFRFVVDTGKGIVNVDTHLGKVKVTNERDESRKSKEMVKELKGVFSNEAMLISFSK